MPNLRQNVDVDIIVRGSNKVPLVRKLLASIKRSAPKLTCQIIFIDGGSDKIDLTQLMLDRPDILYVSMPMNMGAVRAINIGISHALMSNAPYMLLLDNDTEIPNNAGNWLERLLARFDREDVGAVGAVSDHAPGMQLAAGPSDNSAVADVPVLDDFALMLRKAAVAQVGLFDEQFDPGLCEDLDYLIRLHDKGWSARIAFDVWVAHKGGETLSRFNMPETMNVNLGKLLEKHGVEKLKQYGLEITEQKAVEPDRRKISLLVPTLNRPEKFKAMLESVRPLVEADKNIEVIVAPIGGDPFSMFEAPWLRVVPRPESERSSVPGFNWCFKHATGDILVVGGDDVVYDHPDFFKIVREEVAQLPGGEGMVDSRVNNVECLQALTRGFVETELGGVFMPGGYRSWFANTEQTARAMRANKHRWTDRAIVSSTNPILDGSPKDATYLEGERWHAQDQAQFVARMAAGFPDEWEQVK
jgi:hypothetical protein